MQPLCSGRGLGRFRVEGSRVLDLGFSAAPFSTLHKPWSGVHISAILVLASQKIVACKFRWVYILSGLVGYEQTHTDKPASYTLSQHHAGLVPPFS